MFAYFFFSALIGYVIGTSKNRPTEGLLAVGIFGILGFIWIVFFRTLKVR